MPSSPCATAPTALAICNCKRARKRHEHGEYGTYKYHRCRCAPCKWANAEYNRLAKQHRSRREMVDADLVRARVAKLREAGITVLEMAELCAMSPKVLNYAVNGRGGRKPKKVQASTFRALNAIGFKDIASLDRPGGRPVNGDVSRSQVQSLYSFGWPSSMIAQRIGVSRHSIKALLAGQNITEAARAAIDSFYAEVRGTEPVLSTPSERAASTAARNRAIANGWTADTATDHEYARYSRAH
ncbi:hypothetical protein [Pseudarthrobacter chlorophenolicus]|nr:hypothetical protein [Pseudarthrobacter chlorophenolicus]